MSAAYGTFIESLQEIIPKPRISANYYKALMEDSRMLSDLSQIGGI